MLGLLKTDLDEKRKINPDYKAPNMAASVGVPTARKIWEDQILKELPEQSNSLQNSIERATLREQLRNDLTAEKAAPLNALSINPEDFNLAK